MNSISNTGLINILGLFLNGAGVLLLAYEVWVAQKTELMSMHIRQALRHATSVREDPVGQARRDASEFKALGDKATAAEKLAAALTEAVLDTGPPEWLLEDIKRKADDLYAEVKRRTDALDLKVTPQALNRRKWLLWLGFLLVVVGIALQGVSTYLNSQPQ